MALHRLEPGAEPMNLLPVAKLCKRFSVRLISVIFFCAYLQEQLAGGIVSLSGQAGASLPLSGRCAIQTACDRFRKSCRRTDHTRIRPRFRAVVARALQGPWMKRSRRSAHSIPPSTMWASRAEIKDAYEISLYLSGSSVRVTPQPGSSCYRGRIRSSRSQFLSWSSPNPFRATLRLD